MQYIEEKIGDDYLKWDNTDIILINAPTGSGKTQFCLHKLLCDRAVRREERILYLVNRKVLKKQLIEDIKKYERELTSNGTQYISLRNYITIQTYQEIEIMLATVDVDNLGKSIEVLRQYQNMYSMVIYDECHYFYADSNFNTYTQLSYDFLTHCFNEKIQIFMSATMEKVKGWIKTHIPQYGKEQHLMNYNPYHVLKRNRKIENRLREFGCEKDYSYINLNILDKVEDIEKIIINAQNKKEKWLIFVDNKDLGKKLSDCLRKSIGEENKDVVYIDADYSKDIDTANTVEFLAANKKTSEKIVITTAVMDNGISFQDDELRNLVILADTEEEFIQMLGRKRTDGQNLNVYFCRRDVKHFQKRLQIIERQISSYINNAKGLEENYCWYIYSENGEFIKKEHISPFTLYRNCFGQCKNEKLNTYANGEVIRAYLPQPTQQQKFLKSILESPEFYNNTRSYVYYYNGLAAINELSVKRLFERENFYRDLIEKFETNEWAFAEEVLRWIGYSENAICEKIEENSIGLDEKYYSKIEEILNEHLEEVLDSNQNEELKMELRESLKYLIINNASFEKKDIATVTKTGRTLSDKLFNKIMNEINLPYMMEKPDKSHFIIKKKDR